LASEKKRLQVDDDMKKLINNIQQQQAFFLCVNLGLQTTWDKSEVLFTNVLGNPWEPLGNMMRTHWEQGKNKNFPSFHFSLP
jgi:hypothetical protein